MRIQTFAMILSLIVVFPLPRVAAQEKENELLESITEALVSGKTPLGADVRDKLECCKWEALAYWDTTTEASSEEVEEAVEDIYEFKKGNYRIELQDRKEGSGTREFEGKYSLQGERKLVLRNKNSSAGGNIIMEIMLLTDEYLILQIDELRIFFTRHLSREEDE